MGSQKWIKREKKKKSKVLKVAKPLEKRQNLGMSAMEFRVMGKQGEKLEFWTGQD